MSYDLLIFDAGAASGPAAHMYEAVCAGHPRAAGRSALLRRFVERLQVELPEVFTECEVEDASMDPDGSYVLLSLPLGSDQGFVDRLMVIVADSGLTAFDPQLEPAGRAGVLTSVTSYSSPASLLALLTRLGRCCSSTRMPR